MCVESFSIFAITGCGGNSCQTITCGNIENEDYGISANSCSIPDCNGYSCNFMKVKAEQSDMIACNRTYYAGCLQGQKSCYVGYINGEEDDFYVKGVFYGNSDTEEKLIGSLNGCIGCFNSRGIGWEI